MPVVAVLSQPGGLDLLERLATVQIDDAVSFHSTHQSAGGVIERDVVIDFAAESWRVMGADGRVHLAHRDGVRSSPDGDQRGLRWREMPPDRALQLALPESLYVWGRTEDDYFPLLEERDGDTSVVTIVHRRDTVMRGAMLIDWRRGMITRLVRPTDATTLSQITRSSGGN